MRSRLVANSLAGVGVVRVGRRVVGMRPERDRLAQHAPRLHAGRLDSREPQPRQSRRALPVAAQPGRRCRRGPARARRRRAAGRRCRRRGVPRASIASTLSELGLGVREPPCGDGAEDEQRAQLEHVVRRPRAAPAPAAAARAWSSAARGVAEAAPSGPRGGCGASPRVHGPSSSSDQRQRAQAASTAPAGSPTFSRAWREASGSAGAATSAGRDRSASRSSRSRNAGRMPRGRLRAASRPSPLSRRSPSPGPIRASSARIGAAAPVVRDHRAHQRHQPARPRRCPAAPAAAAQLGDARRRPRPASMITRRCSPRSSRRRPSAESSSRRPAGRRRPATCAQDRRRGWSPRRASRPSASNCSGGVGRPAVAVGVVAAPRRAAPPGAASSSPASLELHPAELADGLEHPVADAAAAPSTTVSSDWSTSSSIASSASAPSIASAAARVNPSWKTERASASPAARARRAGSRTSR